MAAVCENVLQLWEQADDLGQQQLGSVIVLDIGGVDRGMDQITSGPIPLPGKTAIAV